MYSNNFSSLIYFFLHSPDEPKEWIMDKTRSVLVHYVGEEFQQQPKQALSDIDSI